MAGGLARWQVTGLKSGLFSPALGHQLDDAARRPAGQQSGNVVEMNPATFCYFVAGASLGAVRDFAGEHVVVFLLATQVEEIPG
jgi:hypothetical protein